MTSDELIKVRQDLVGLFDTLFNKIISGTSIGPRENEAFYNVLTKIALKFAQLSETVALEKCKAINDATRNAFSLMEKDLDQKLSDLKNEIESLKNK